MSNTDLILPNFYKKGVKKVEQYGIAGTHYTMAAPKAFVEALLPAGIARRNRTIGIRKREEIEKMSEQSAADMVAGVIQGKNIIEQSPKGKVDDLISDGAINKSYGYEQLSMANKADVKNAMFNKYVDFDIPEHIQDRMMNHMYFGPYKTGKGVVGTNVTGFVGEQFKVPVLLKPIDPAKTTIDIKNPKGIQNQAYEAHGGHSRGPAKLNRLFNVNGRAKLAVVISKLDKNGNDKFAGKKNSIDNKTNIKKEAKNIKNVDNIIANATPEQMKKALATSWGTKEGSDIGIVFKVDEKNPNTIYFQDVYKSGSKESGGVNAMIAVDLDSKKVYNMVTDKHDMLANFKPFGVGSTDRITGTVPTMRSFANIKEKGNHVGRDFKEEARLSLKQLDEKSDNIPVKISNLPSSLSRTVLEREQDEFAAYVSYLIRIAKESGNSYKKFEEALQEPSLTKLVIAQYQARLYPECLPVPNVVPIYDELHRPTWKENEVPLVSFTPSSCTKDPNNIFNNKKKTL